MATKKVETKTAAPILEVKKDVSAVKKTVEKAVEKLEVKPAEKAAPVKKETKKEALAEKKPAVKKAEKKEPKASVVVEYLGNQIAAKDVLTQAKKAFTKANKGVEIKTIELYIKPEEGVAYYVVNGKGSEDYKVIL